MCCYLHLDGWAVFSLSLYMQVSHVPHVCVDFDSSYFLRTDVLLATVCTRTWSRALRSPLYANDNSALFFLSRNDGQMASPLETSLDSVWRQLQEGLRGRMGTRGLPLRILWSRIGVSLEDPGFWYFGTQDPADKKTFHRLAHDTCDKSDSNCGPYWAPRHAAPSVYLYPRTTAGAHLVKYHRPLHFYLPRHSHLGSHIQIRVRRRESPQSRQRTHQWSLSH